MTEVRRKFILGDPSIFRVWLSVGTSLRDPEERRMKSVDGKELSGAQPAS